MKNQLSLYALLATALLAATSCSHDSGQGASTPDGPTALQVKGGINVQTRASYKSWEANDTIGIYMYATGKTTVSGGMENIPYKTEAGDGAFAPASAARTIYFPIDGSNADFRAWYPYQDVAEKWTSDLTVQTSQAAIDLMTADARSNTQEGGTVYNSNQCAVVLNFSHRLTKLVLNITNGNGVSTAELGGLKVEITGQWKTVLYDPAFDALGFEEESATIPLLTNSGGTFAEAILFPDDVAKKNPVTGRQLVFTLSNAPEEVFYWNIPDTKSFNSGEKNIYNISINRTGLSVTSTVTDWTAGNNDGETGEAE